MRKALLALFTVFVLLSASPAPAQPRDYRQPDRDRYDNRDKRVSVQGRVRSVSRDRDGYRVYLDRGTYAFWVPGSVLGRRQLRVGVEIRLGGVFRGGYVYVDALGWPGDPNYNDPYDDHGQDLVIGRVERVDYRTGRLVIREARSGRSIDVDARTLDDRRRRIDLSDVRRGDRITLRGTWTHGVFRAWRIESITQR